VGGWSRRADRGLQAACLTGRRAASVKPIAGTKACRTIPLQGGKLSGAMDRGARSAHGEWKIAPLWHVGVGSGARRARCRVPLLRLARLVVRRPPASPSAFELRDFTTIDGHVTPLTVEVDAPSTGRRTVFRLRQVRYDRGLPESAFSLARMNRGR
jgi:hypothetical protein